MSPVDIARNLIGRGALDEADRVLADALQQGNNPQVLLLRGDLARRQGRYADARAAYEAAIATHPNRDRVRLRLIGAAVEVEDWTTAASISRELDSDAGRFHAALLLWDPAEALRLGRRLSAGLALPPRDTCNAYLQLLFELNLYGEARVFIRRLADKPGFEGAVARFEFWIAYETRGPRACLQLSDTSLPTDPELAWCHRSVRLLHGNVLEPLKIVGDLVRFWGFLVGHRAPALEKLLHEAPTSTQTPLSGIIVDLKAALAAHLLATTSLYKWKRVGISETSKAVPWMLGRATLRRVQQALCQEHGNK